MRSRRKSQQRLESNDIHLQLNLQPYQDAISNRHRGAVMVQW